MRTLAQSARDMEAGASSRSLVEECLARIADPAGEGRRVFLKVHAETARAAADYVDSLRRHGAAPSRFAGIPVSIKDLFDVAGDVTMSGSVALRDAPPAAADATAVARLRAAGLIPIGRTNMTEFAFTGLGINPHYDTPRNPYDRATGRLPGGSSSGAAVSVTDGMAAGALGTDTGGSCRIPAALCGIVGYKPTAKRIPLGGVLPLSFSLDSVGPLAPTVACCAALDAIMAGEEPADLEPFPLRGLRLAAPQAVVLDDLDATVSRSYAAALSALSKAGAGITDIPLHELDGDRDAQWARRLCGVGSLCVAPPADRGQGRALRSPRAHAHHARQGHGCGGIHRTEPRPRRPDPPGRGDHQPLRCAGDADGSASSRRRSPNSTPRSATARSICRCCATRPSPTCSTAAPFRCPATVTAKRRWG